MAKLYVFENSGNPDQTPCSVASDLGMYCLPITLLGLSRLQCVNKMLRCMNTKAKGHYSGHVSPQFILWSINFLI